MPNISGACVFPGLNSHLIFLVPPLQQNIFNKKTESIVPKAQILEEVRSMFGAIQNWTDTVMHQLLPPLDQGQLAMLLFTCSRFQVPA